jgi:Mce-associated membrane protein
MAVNADTTERTLEATSAEHPDADEHSSATDERPGDKSKPETTDAQPEHPTAETPAPHTRHTQMRAAVVLSLVLLATFVGLGIWTGRQIAQDRDGDVHRQMLVGVGRQAALNLTTIDFATVNDDIKRILDSTTGSFHDDFQKRSGPFIQAVTEAKSRSEGTVTEAGLESIDGDDAQVLVAVAVKTSIAGTDEPAPRAWRMRITVTQPAGQDAKVSNVQFVA